MRELSGHAPVEAAAAGHSLAMLRSARKPGGSVTLALLSHGERSGREIVTVVFAREPTVVSDGTMLSVGENPGVPQSGRS